MQELYDSEMTRLELGSLQSPPFLPLFQAEYDWYKEEIFSKILHQKSKEELLADVESGKIPLTFRGTPIKIDEQIRT